MAKKKLKVFLEQHRKNGPIDIKIRLANNPRAANWFIGSITKKGTLELTPYLPAELGLQIDNEGRIIVENNNG